MDIPNKKRGTLLVIDDEPEIVAALVTILSPIANKVLTASNGQEALDIIRKDQVDAVLSDINMPVMTGFQLLSELRHSLIDVPFVILTAFGDKDNLLEALRLNATDFIEKPFDLNKVTETMQRMLALGLALKELEDVLSSRFKGENLPKTEVVKIKKLKKVILSMRLTNAQLPIKKAS